MLLLQFLINMASKDSSTSSEKTSTTTVVEPPVPSPRNELAGIALSMRIPKFWRDRVKLWFITFEAVTADMKKGHKELAQMVVAQLEKQDVEQIADLLFKPPENLYDALKERLTSVYEESEDRQLQKLLSEMELGDQKPTQLLRRMRSLAHDNIKDETLRMMWMNLLPAHVRSVLVVSDKIGKQTALDDLALLADKMMEQSQQVSSLSHTPERNETQALVEEVRKLSLEVAELKRFQERSRPRFRRNTPHSRSQSRTSSSRTHSATKSPFCYYHRKFKEDARRCVPPCTFKKEKSEN